MTRSLRSRRVRTKRGHRQGQRLSRLHQNQGKDLFQWSQQSWSHQGKYSNRNCRSTNSNHLDMALLELALDAVEIGGIAFAGYRGIQGVEVSTDNGATWQQATLDQPLSPDSWRFWRLDWRPTLAGRYVLVARATDGTGAVQTSKSQPTVPNGATGYHRVSVSVVE